MLERKLTTMSQETPTSTSEEADVILLKEVNDDADLPNLFMEYSEMGNVVNTFPWITDFTKLCQLEFSGINLKRLLKLMNIFHEKVSPSVNECFTRPNRATKLKKIMSNTLMFFHMTYSDFRIMSPSDLSTYLHKMSDLMAMYLDMEIKASRTGTECLPKIASKICSSLIIYFGKSYEYIFDTILKSKLITDNARVLCDLIFRRVLRDFPGPCIDVISYLRCLFVFKIWKAITKDSEEKLKIIKLACTKLQPPPGLASKLSVSKALRSFLPKVPRKCLDVTEFLMRAKFCSRNQIKLFLKAAEDPNVFHEFQPSMDHSAQSDNADRSGFVGLMDDLWSDFSTKFRGSISTSVENEKIIKHEHNTAKNEVKKVKKLKKIIEVDRNGSVKDNKSHAAPVKNDVDDLLVTSSLVRGPKSNIDEIYIDAIDSCVKSEGESDPSVSCMKELLDNNTIPSNINLYGGTYDEPVASTSCVKVELNAALIEDPFIDNLSDTGITIGKLSDIAIGPKEDIFMRDCEDANTPLITSNSLFSKTHKNFPSIQNCEKIGKYNYSALNFRSKSLLLIQDDEISESDLHSFENSGPYILHDCIGISKLNFQILFLFKFS